MTDVRSLAQVLEHVDESLRSGVAATAHTWPTGFAALDEVLGGGLHAGELTLLGGSQGLGKTTFALQIARNVAAGGGRALYLCFEHREEDVLQRRPAAWSSAWRPRPSASPRSSRWPPSASDSTS